MSFWILDTDHVSAVLRGNQSVINRAAQQHPNVVITVITVQELFNGWMGKINQTSDSRKLVNLYSKLTQTIDLIKALQILNFDSSANQVYESLRQQFPVLARKRIEKDLRIASICLAQNAILVTRNTQDFALIPKLTLENWFES